MIAGTSAIVQTKSGKTRVGWAPLVHVGPSYFLILIIETTRDGVRHRRGTHGHPFLVLHCADITHSDTPIITAEEELRAELFLDAGRTSMEINQKILKKF